MARAGVRRGMRAPRWSGDARQPAGSGVVAVAVVVVTVVVAVMVVAAPVAVARQPGDGERLRARREVRVDGQVGVARAGDRRRALQERAGARALELAAAGAVAQLDEAQLR